MKVYTTDVELNGFKIASLDETVDTNKNLIFLHGLLG